MGQGLMVNLDFESRTKFDPGERYRPTGCGSGSRSGMSRVFEGSIDSPTSPLDIMMFPRLRDAIRSPRDRPPRQNSWDCIKVGLRSIVDDLDDDDERNSFGGTSRSSYGKSIVSGPKPRIKELHRSNSSVVFEIGEAQLGSSQNRNFLSCSVDSCSFENRRHPSDGKSPGSDFHFTVKGFDSHLPGSDLELSEDYTCVISHGPGATTRTTHIFDDCVLECHPIDCASTTITEQAEVRNSGLDQLNGFLRTCYACKKSLEEGEDIYIYGGDKAFCCEECRMKEILLEGDPEELLMDSGDSQQHGRGDGDF